MNNTPRNELVGVVLAAGIGSRLRPLTDHAPKALYPVNGVPLLDSAIGDFSLPDSRIAVNAHHYAGQLIQHLAGRAIIVSVEETLLRSAGAIGKLAPWIRGRPVAIRNADTWLRGDLSTFWRGWDQKRPRLLVKDIGVPADFGSLRFLGLSLLPATSAAELSAEPAGLNDLVWTPAYEQGRLDFVHFEGTAIDCGTPADYLDANLAANHGHSVIAEDSSVFGDVVESLVLPGGRVTAGERLYRHIRGPTGIDISA